MESSSRGEGGFSAQQLCERISLQTQDASSVMKMEFLFQKLPLSLLSERCCSQHLCFLWDCCITTMLDAVDRSPSCTSQIFEASAALKRALILSKDTELIIDTDRLEPIFQFIWKYWDFVLDVVCYDCSDIFSLILEDHIVRRCVSCKEGSHCDWIKSTVSKLFSLSDLCRAKFKCVISTLQLCPILSSKEVTDPFIVSLYDHLGNPSLAVVLSELVCYDLETQPQRWSLHIDSIISHLSSQSSGLKVALVERLLPKIVKSHSLSREFLGQLMQRLQGVHSSDSSLSALLAISKFVIFSQKRCEIYKKWSDFVSHGSMARAVLHSDSQMRLAAWYLLCEHPKRTEVITTVDRKLIRGFITSNIAEQNPAIRQKILASLKMLLIRMCEVVEGMGKGRIKMDDGEDYPTEYINVIRYIVDLAFESLEKGANVSRRLTSLSIISLVFVGNHLQHNGKVHLSSLLSLPSLLSPSRYSLLIECLDDSYQLCQITALELLKSLNYDQGFDWDSFLSTTHSRMLSIRSHDTLSSGFRFRFLISQKPEMSVKLLEEMISLCESRVSLLSYGGISLICSSATLHPILSTIALLLEEKSVTQISPSTTCQWQCLWSSRLLPLCLSISHLVRPVVHSLSPEGFIPQELLAEMTSKPGDQSIRVYSETSQLLLACCWRAHKQISGILAWCATNLPCPSVLSPSEISLIGEYYWTELTECKHCGAFESAVEGFESLCRRLWNGVDGDGLPHPMKWIEEILNGLDGKLDGLCSTRRSAGLPHLICSICSTEPDGGRALSTVLERLMDVEKKTEEYRIHSLNVLKAIFSSSKLGDRVLPAMEIAVRIAVHGCASSFSWSLRNSSAQLMSSLRIRLFGVTRNAQRDLVVDMKNRMSAYEFFSRFPSLYSFLFDHLSTASDELSVFPSLVILTHLFPTVSPTYPLAPFIPVLLKILSSARSEKLRRLAVGSLHAICMEEDTLFILKWIHSLNWSTVPQNSLDGLLHFIVSYVEQFPNRTKEMKMAREITEEIVRDGTYREWCDYVQNHLFLLCDHFGIGIDLGINEELIDNMTLTIRPIASLLLQSISSPPPSLICISSLSLRNELYRLIRLRSLVLSSQWNCLLDMAIDDVINREETMAEREVECIVDVLFVNRNGLSIEQCSILKKNLSSRLRGKEFAMPSTISIVHRLCISLSAWSLSSSDIDWLINCGDSGSDDAMEIALEVVQQSLKHKNTQDDILPVVFSFLQDTEQYIRDSASQVLSPFLMRKEDIHLNSSVVCGLMVNKYPHLMDRRKEEDEEKDEESLFSSCLLNPFSENRQFGSFVYVQDVLDMF